MTKLFFLLSIICTFTKAAGQNIGIGTKTPVNKLEVINSVESSQLATVYANNTGTAGSGLH